MLSSDTFLKPSAIRDSVEHAALTRKIVTAIVGSLKFVDTWEFLPAKPFATEHLVHDTYFKILRSPMVCLCDLRLVIDGVPVEAPASVGIGPAKYLPTVFAAVSVCPGFFAKTIDDEPDIDDSLRHIEERLRSWAEARTPHRNR